MLCYSITQSFTRILIVLTFFERFHPLPNLLQIFHFETKYNVYLFEYSHKHESNSVYFFLVHCPLSEALEFRVLVKYVYNSRKISRMLPLSRTNAVLNVFCCWLAIKNKLIRTAELLLLWKRFKRNEEKCTIVRLLLVRLFAVELRFVSIIVPVRLVCKPISESIFNLSEISKSSDLQVAYDSSHHHVYNNETKIQIR